MDGVLNGFLGEAPSQRGVECSSFISWDGLWKGCGSLTQYLLAPGGKRGKVPPSLLPVHPHGIWGRTDIEALTNCSCTIGQGELLQASTGFIWSTPKKSRSTCALRSPGLCLLKEGYLPGLACLGWVGIIVAGSGMVFPLNIFWKYCLRNRAKANEMRKKVFVSHTHTHTTCFHIIQHFNNLTTSWSHSHWIIGAIM